MNYHIEPRAWQQVFAVPGAVVDEHLKLAGAVQLKVLLWLLRHNGEAWDADRMSGALGIAVADIRDALQYWVETGLLLEAGAVSPPPAQPVTIPAQVPAAPPERQPEPNRAPTAPVKPSFADVAKRGEESAEIRFLFSEAQMRLAKTLSPAAQSTLIWLHDHWGMPVSVILMVIEYCVSENKRGMGYIEAVALEWASQEIDTIEKADQKIHQILQSRKAWNQVCKLLEIPQRKATKKEETFVRAWLEEWQFSGNMLAAAYEICINNTGKLSFNYMHKILQSWYEQGIRTRQDILEKDTKPAAKGTAPSAGKRPQEADAASYDLTAFEEMLKLGPFQKGKEETHGI